jgi:hypothetical protein
MSTSRLDVQDGRAVLELRVPEYEARHVPGAERAIPQAITIGGVAPVGVRCAAEGGAFVCRGEYPVDVGRPLNVKCTLAEVIVENHVHVMHAARGGRVDQAVFNAGTEEAILEFRQAGALESAVRSRPELVGVLLLSTFAAGALASIAGCIVFVAAAIGALALRFVTWQLTPGFMETVVVVTAGYAAFEALFLPPSALRPVVAGVLGAVLGVYVFAIVPAAGPGSAMLIACAAATLLLTLLARRAGRARRAAASLVLTTALAWVIWSLW